MEYWERCLGLALGWGSCGPDWPHVPLSGPPLCWPRRPVPSGRCLSPCPYLPLQQQTCFRIGPCLGSLERWAWQPPGFELEWWPGQTQVMGNVVSSDSALLVTCWAVQAGYLSTWTRASSLRAGGQAALLPTSLAPVGTCYAALWSCGPRAWWCPPPRGLLCPLPCSLDSVGLVEPRVGGLVGLTSGISLRASFGSPAGQGLPPLFLLIQAGAQPPRGKHWVLR